MKTSEKVQALLDSPISAYRIAKDTSISVSTVLGLRSGDRQLLNITLGTAEKLATYWEKNCNNLGGEIHEK
ncbi:XRE family transcriptional regulator [Levilactobacillus brevis]|mgnify:FL=1|uniref:XRE family transcriptional regulator n=1 Tax=Levilactobacillus brevis TaxID=1580 RepID=UPI0020CC4076|nr:XRE family transcriptional regulator [Levilactobacillus brevis]MCP9615298.1 XRE family transcriptional regulator [Levilactobacillus brevis]